MLNIAIGYNDIQCSIDGSINMQFTTLAFLLIPMSGPRKYNSFSQINSLTFDLLVCHLECIHPKCKVTPWT